MLAGGVLYSVPTMAVPRPASLAFLLVLAATSAAAEGPSSAPLAHGDSQRVVAVIDGDTLVLEDGSEVRLVGIQAPKLALGRSDFAAQPLAEEAKAALEEMTLGQTVALSYGGQRIDRWGRRLAHLHDQRGRWIQGELLASGLARVYTFRDNRALAAAMLAAERAARENGRGIWGDPFFQVRTVAETEALIDTFQIVEGEVLDAAVVRGRAYLNFGADWREDFTVTVSPKDRRAFTSAGLDLESLAGREIRVRGWLDSYNGPQIELTHPEQLEIIER